MLRVDIGMSAQVFILANIALVIGYVTLPLAVVPFLNFRRRTKAAWMVFFAGCVYTHSLSIWQTIHLGNGHGHSAVGWVPALLHVAQALGSWAAIVWALADLQRAAALLTAITEKGESRG